MGLPVSFRFALREMRAGTKGFRVFLACLMLGVGAIAIVGSLSSAFLRGINEEGRRLLGGDIEVEIALREASPEELAWMESTGRVSHTVSMRANAVREDRSRRRLISLKAVDGHHPFLGEVRIDPEMDLQEALAPQDGIPGAIAEGALLRRLGIGIGGRVSIGTSLFEIRGRLVSEPDSISGGFRLGPRVLISVDVLRQANLLQVGSLRDHEYRILLPDPATEADIEAWREAAQEAFPESDWQVRDRTNAARGTQRFVRQMDLFLTLVGLTTLLVGGVGVGNAVKGYMDRKRRDIAILKSLGAGGALIFRVYFLQVLLLAGTGILVGLSLGIAVPFAIGTLFAESLPIPARFDIYPRALVLAAAYGALVTTGFSVWPLARARMISAASLFRDIVAPEKRWPGLGYVVLTALSIIGIAVLAVTFTRNQNFSAGFLLAAAIAFLLLRVAAQVIRVLARAAGRPRLPELRLALANLYRPGAVMGSVVLSLGLGLTLLVAVALISGNISRRLSETLPERAPAFFFVDIPSAGIDEFRAIVNAIPGAGDLTTIANLRGWIVRLKGVPAQEAEIDPDARWVLRGDRGFTYARTPPINATVIDGEWWAEDYEGPTLASVDAEMAARLRLRIGDTLTVNILGRDITAEVSNLRRIDWDRIGLNFFFIFSPGVLDKAPHTFVATVNADSPETEDLLETRIGDTFPSVSIIRVRETLESVNALLTDLGRVIQGAGSITLIAGVLVLAGAMAAGHRQRLYDASILKVLGATRPRIFAIYLIEYGLMGLATSLMAAGAGTLAAYVVVTQVMEDKWTFLPGTVVTTVAVATVVTILTGFVGAYRSLGQPASRVLRSEQ